MGQGVKLHKGYTIEHSKTGLKLQNEISQSEMWLRIIQI